MRFRIHNCLLQAKNEVKVLNSLNHPNIVKYYECYQERNMMHIIMELCEVGPLCPACTRHAAATESCGPVCLARRAHASKILCLPAAAPGSAADACSQHVLLWQELAATVSPGPGMLLLA